MNQCAMHVLSPWRRAKHLVLVQHHFLFLSLSFLFFFFFLSVIWTFMLVLKSESSGEMQKIDCSQGEKMWRSEHASQHI